MMEYGLIGERLSHSYSREVHSLLADYTYELCEVARDGLDAFMREHSFKGINVTIPYKEAVIPYLDYIDPVAKEIGAVNTVVNRGGKLYGYNTDAYGMTRLIEKSGIIIAGKTVAILGSGGTAKTAHVVARELGAKNILTVSRTGGDGCITYGELYSTYADCEVIINTTPVGMYPNIDNAPVDLNKFHKLSGVIDVIYNPLRTSLALDAKKLGIPYGTGLYMLVMQALRACELFLGEKIDEDAAEGVYREILKKKENTVLIGMPSSGKSSVGKALAGRLSQEFTDTDVTIEELAGVRIAEIFKKSGEEAFRDIESEAVEAVSKKNGTVIATGGGAILREKNVRALQKNGRLYFLDRPPEMLIATEDRPLSSDTEELKKRYVERYPIYTAVCDEKIDGSGTVDEVTDLILESKK